MADLIRVELRAPFEESDAITLFLTQHAPHGWEEESGPTDTIYRVHFEDSTATREIVSELSRRFPSAEMAVDNVQEQNWNAAWHEFFKPIEIAGELTVVPSWLAGTADTREIVIHPAMAFGTGHHATTRLCLEAIMDLKAAGLLAEYRDFLDLGTGSGILAIAAAGEGLQGIGLDIDPVAVDNAKLNVKTNKRSSQVRLATGGLEALQQGIDFDLVTANILAGPLIEMAGDLTRRIRLGGSLILSGILTEQAEAVKSAYAKAGLQGPATRNEAEWTSFIYRKEL